MVLAAVPREDIVYLDVVSRIHEGVANDVTRARRLLDPRRDSDGKDKGRIVLPA